MDRMWHERCFHDFAPEPCTARCGPGWHFHVRCDLCGAAAFGQRGLKGSVPVIAPGRYPLSVFKGL